jgi:flagellar biosynthesis/type III secretory pathway protein FliH
MSMRLHRYNFENLRDFRAPVVAPAVEEEVIEVAPPPPPVFSQSELDAACAAAKKMGFTQGFDAGIARAAEQEDAKKIAVDATIMQIGGILTSLHRQYYQLLRTESEALSQLVLMIAQKVTGAALDTQGAESIAAMIDQCLPAVLSKPRLTVELHSGAFESTIDRIETLMHTNGFEGELQFRTNDTLGRYDAILDWGSGQAERNTATLWQEIESLLATVPVKLALPELEIMEEEIILPAGEAKDFSDAAPLETPPTT